MSAAITATAIATIATSGAQLTERAPDGSGISLLGIGCGPFPNTTTRCLVRYRLRIRAWARSFALFESFAGTRHAGTPHGRVYGTKQGRTA